MDKMFLKDIPKLLSLLQKQTPILASTSCTALKVYVIKFENSTLYSIIKYSEYTDDLWFA